MSIPFRLLDRCVNEAIQGCEHRSFPGSEPASHSGCCGRFWLKEQTKGVSKLDPEAQKLKEIEAKSISKGVLLARRATRLCRGTSSPCSASMWR